MTTTIAIHCHHYYHLSLLFLLLSSWLQMFLIFRKSCRKISRKITACQKGPFVEPLHRHANPVRHGAHVFSVGPVSCQPLVSINILWIGYDRLGKTVWQKLCFSELRKYFCLFVKNGRAQIQEFRSTTTFQMACQKYIRNTVLHDIACQKNMSDYMPH